MNEEVELILEDTEEKMQRSLKHLDNELSKIRAGRANVHMLDGIMVNYYGNPTPLQQISNINTPDPRTLAIQPWEKNMIDQIEKSILAANLGLTPMNNGEIIRINVPMLTEDRRRDLVKRVKTEGENARVGVRNNRREGNDQLKKLIKDGLSEDAEKDAEDLVQEMTDKYIRQIDEKLAAKEKDIMTI
ncbi:MAG: ribosome recycling factor [Bacteroidetes bacterium GWF2_49_14]|nr:MAG: ribosome recycling factor [Bacteroidetes bacterium GWF2_49_14]